MRTALSWWLAYFHALALISLASAEELPREVPFRLDDGYRIVAEGSISGGRKLNLMIDTGAEYSVVDRRAARRLGFTIIPQEVRLECFGQTGTAGRAIVPGLRLGPTVTSLPALVADMRFNGVDLIVELDLLRRLDFTIDYQARRLIFGRSAPLENSILFERGPRLVMVAMRIGARILRVSLDTGSPGLCLYAEDYQSRSDEPADSLRLSLVSLHGETPGRQIPLAGIFLGDCEWRLLNAAVVRPTQPLERDGTLGIAPLELARIHFDFERCIVSWNRLKR